MSKELTKQEYEAQLKQNKADQKIAQEAFEQEQARIEKELAGMEVTYSTADRFMLASGEKVMLVITPDNSKLLMISLGNGNYWGTSHKRVEDRFRITQREFEDMTQNMGRLKRYWDNRKQVNV